MVDRDWKTYNDSVVSDTREEDVRQRRQTTGYIFFYMHRSVVVTGLRDSEGLPLETT